MVVGRQRYYPYGANRPASAPLPTDYRFTGQRNESTIALYDYGARFYDPVLGRFVSADTVVPEPGNPQALNRYSYCYNNPLKYTDPTGHMVDPDGPTGRRRKKEPPDTPPYPPALFENYPQAREWYELIFSLEAEGITPYVEGEEYQVRHFVTRAGFERNEKRQRLTTLKGKFGQLWNRYRVNFADSPEDGPREVYDFGVVGMAFGTAAVGGKAVSWLGDNVDFPSLKDAYSHPDSLIPKSGAYVNGRWYSQHALARMQPSRGGVRYVIPGENGNSLAVRGRGPIAFSWVEDAIAAGRTSQPGRDTFISTLGDLTVITNQAGSVVTVGWNL